MKGEDIRTRQARARLGLEREADAEALRAAFRRAVKTAHPDRGGSPEQFRLVLDAYRLLKAEAEAELGPAAVMAAGARPSPDAPAEPAAARPVIRISIAEAFLGGAKTIRLEDGRRGKVRLPPGLRSGDVVRFGPGGRHGVSVLIVAEAGAEVRGADLWLTTPVSAEFLKTGGRLDVRTPLGARRLWVSRTSAARGLFRAPGEGLPAAGSRPRGHLYLKLELDAGLADSPARSLLRRFAADWAA